MRAFAAELRDLFRRVLRLTRLPLRHGQSEGFGPSSLPPERLRTKNRTPNPWSSTVGCHPGQWLPRWRDLLKSEWLESPASQRTES